MSDKSYIECGKVINTHGCHGGIKLDSWCNSPVDLASLKQIYLKKNEEYTPFRVLKASVFKQFVIFTLKGIDTMDLALALKNKTVYAQRSDFNLEDGEYFIADMIGLKVIHADSGKILGTLVEIINRGASDIYVVKTPDGEKMMPAVDEFVDHVNIKEGVFVRPIDGMLD